MADVNGVQNVNNEPRNDFQINARDRLFHAIFIKSAAIYIRVIPKWCRALLELVILAKAVILFTTLSYVHFTFSKNPMDCLEKFKDNWPRDGILQVQILKDQPMHVVKQALSLPPYFASGWNQSLVRNVTLKDNNQCLPGDKMYEEGTSNATIPNEVEMDSESIDSVIDDEYLAKRDTFFYDKVYPMAKVKYQQQATYLPTMQHLLHFYANKQVKDYYLMEYSLEYGFLRLSQETRKKLNISIKVVTLDPKSDKCFGDTLSRFILDKLLGYDDLLMASIKRLAEAEGSKGYMKNVLTGEHYKFVTTWMGRTSYVVSFLLMFVFTISISTLLRFCHQQIFIFIVHLLHVMDWNVTLMFPVAPMFTVILSLVGMEAIMAEFFNDTTTSFYVILIVWAADQFDSICCHTRLSQKFWLRFFFLYHFLFYAYHYRFNGQYSTIALAASWFFIQHSMLYFLHNYEIPAIEAALNARGVNYLDDAVDLLVDEMQFPPIPVHANATQDNASQQPETANAQLENSSPQPENASPPPENSSPQPENSSPQPENSNPQPENSSPQPEISNPQPENASLLLGPSAQPEFSSHQPLHCDAQPPASIPNGSDLQSENFLIHPESANDQMNTSDQCMSAFAEVRPTTVFNETRTAFDNASKDIVHPPGVAEAEQCLTQSAFAPRGNDAACLNENYEDSPTVKTVEFAQPTFEEKSCELLEAKNCIQSTLSNNGETVSQCTVGESSLGSDVIVHGNNWHLNDAHVNSK